MDSTDSTAVDDTATGRARDRDCFDATGLLSLAINLSPSRGLLGGGQGRGGLVHHPAPPTASAWVWCCGPDREGAAAQLPARPRLHDRLGHHRLGALPVLAGHRRRPLLDHLPPATASGAGERT